jgi:hypothetical protein
MTNLLRALLFLGLVPVLFPVISRVKILKSMTLLSGKRPQFLISLLFQWEGQTTRSLKDRASLLKSRRRRQGHINNFSQERINSSPQLVFRRHRRVSDTVPLAGQTKSVTSTDVGSPRESEVEDSSVSSKDQLRARVYSLLRERN